MRSPFIQRIAKSRRFICFRLATQGYLWSLWMVVWLILKCDVVTTVATWVTWSTRRIYFDNSCAQLWIFDLLRHVTTSPCSQHISATSDPWNHQGHVDLSLFLSFKRSLEICLVAGTFHATAADVFRTDANKQCTVTAMAFFFVIFWLLLVLPLVQNQMNYLEGKTWQDVGLFWCRCRFKLEMLAMGSCPFNRSFLQARRDMHICKVTCHLFVFPTETVSSKAGVQQLPFALSQILQFPVMLITWLICMTIQKAGYSRC